jgi:hypothetical protein
MTFQTDDSGSLEPKATAISFGMLDNLNDFFQNFIKVNQLQNKEENIDEKIMAQQDAIEKEACGFSS